MLNLPTHQWDVCWLGGLARLVQFLQRATAKALEGYLFLACGLRLLCFENGVFKTRRCLELL